MTKFLTVLSLILLPLFSQAAGYQCASMSDAQVQVEKRFNIDPSDSYATTLYGADEYYAGGKQIIRKIVVRINSAHNAQYEDMVVTYTILKSFDGPDNGDYCSFSGIDFKSDVCKALPDSVICRKPTK